MLITIYYHKERALIDDPLPKLNTVDSITELYTHTYTHLQKTTTKKQKNTHTQALQYT